MAVTTLLLASILDFQTIVALTSQFGSPNPTIRLLEKLRQVDVRVIQQ